MNTKEAKQSVQMDKALFDFYGKPSIGQSLPLAIQHVLAMIVGCVTPSIIVAGVAGLSQEDSVILIPVSYTHLICYKALIFIEIHGFCRFSLFSSISCWIFQSVDCIIVPMMIYGLLIILII